jgi:hypothetical protein
MARASRIAPARITTAVKAVEDAGVRIGTVEVLPDGTIKVTALDEARERGDKKDLFEIWRARRGPRPA